MSRRRVRGFYPAWSPFVTTSSPAAPTSSIPLILTRTRAYGRAGATLDETMEIARERFLDTGRDYHLTMGLRSRTTPMHSVLTALTPDERAQVALALAHALDEIERIVRPHLEQPSR